MSWRSSAAPGCGSPRRSTIALPSPETPSLSFITSWASSGRPARSAAMASIASGTERMCSTPAGWGTPARANSSRQPLLVPKCACTGSAPYRGTSRASARSRSSAVVVYGTRWQSSRSRIAHRSRVSSRGRSSSFSASGRAEASPAATSVSRARAPARSARGSSDR